MPLRLLIAAGILIAVAGSRVYGMSARRRRSEEDDRAIAPSPQGGAAPTGSVKGSASSQGWAGPSSDLGIEPMAVDYARQMLRNMWAGGAEVGEVRYEGVYTGEADGRAFAIGNASAGPARSGSVCVLHLGQVLPPLFVNLRAYRPYVRLAMKDVTLESEAFDRRFQVLALDRKYVIDVISERTMELLMERDDWVFGLEFDRLVCVAKTRLGTTEDYRARLEAVSRFASLIPQFVGEDRAGHLPTLPDGSTLDPLDPASRDKLKAAVLAMTPEQREQFLTQARESGARFLAGMFGKDLAPEVIQRVEGDSGESSSNAPAPS